MAIDWSKAPSWANWAVMAINYKWYWLEDKAIWSHYLKDWIAETGRVERMQIQPGRVYADPSESLQSRPHGNADYEARVGAKFIYPPIKKLEAERAHSHYHKEIPPGVTSIDVYAVIELWKVTCPCRQHAIKKLLNAGERGSKDEATDLQEVIDTLNRALEMIKEGY